MNTTLRRFHPFTHDAMPYRSALVWGSVLLFGALAGCKNGHRGGIAAREPVESKPQVSVHNALSLGDPTGIKTYKKAAKAIDAAAQKFGQLTDELSERVAAVPPREIESIRGDLVGSVEAARAQLECARLPEAVHSVQALADQINVTVKALDVEQANSLIAETKESVADIRYQMDRLSEQLVHTNENLRRQLGKVGDQIEALPVQELRDALVEFKGGIALIGEATKCLESALQRAGTTLLAATVTLGMLSLCALAWLVKSVRRRVS